VAVGRTSDHRASWRVMAALGNREARLESRLTEEVDYMKPWEGGRLVVEMVVMTRAQKISNEGASIWSTKTHNHLLNIARVYKPIREGKQSLRRIPTVKMTMP
jgi:hypothetical protein